MHVSNEQIDFQVQQRIGPVNHIQRVIYNKENEIFLHW